MATTSSIGTAARTYSTLQAWEDAVPATPTGGYIGECYNDSEFTAGIVIAGHTTSGANFITLTAATGQSFQDHASVRTNPLIYDQTKGVGIKANPFAEDLIRISNGFVTVSRLQVNRNGASYTTATVGIDASLSTVLVKDCIIAKTYSGTNAIANIRPGTLVNCLLYDTGATAATGAVTSSDTGTLINCTVARSGSAGGTGVVSSYHPFTLNNCAVFGWTTVTSTASGGTFSGNYNATNGTSIVGANSIASQTYANCFESVTADYRLKAGSPLIAAGNTDATNAPNDITATVRGATTAGDIGAWEAAAGGGASTALIGVAEDLQQRITYGFAA